MNSETIPWLDEFGAPRRESECILSVREMGIIAASGKSKGMIDNPKGGMRLGQTCGNQTHHPNWIGPELKQDVTDRKWVSKAEKAVELTNLGRVYQEPEFKRQRLYPTDSNNKIKKIYTHTWKMWAMSLTLEVLQSVCEDPYSSL